MGCGTSTNTPAAQEPVIATEKSIAEHIATTERAAPVSQAEKPSTSDPDMLDNKEAVCRVSPAKSNSSSPRPKLIATMPPPDAQLYSTNEEDDFQCIDMDTPNGVSKKSARMNASLTRMDSSSTLGMQVGTQSQRRFRKRSVNMEMLSPEQLTTIRDSFDSVDVQGTGYISTPNLAEILKANYRPSEVETRQVHSWLDRSGDGKVCFDDYVVVMASVMEKSGVRQEQGIEAAREALSFEMQRRSAAGAQCDTPAPTSASVKAAEEVVGADNQRKMQERWAVLDTSQQGYLEKEQVRELIRLTYVPSEATISAFMRIFTFSEEGLSRDNFVQGMTLLNGDFSFAIQASQAAQG